MPRLKKDDFFVQITNCNCTFSCSHKGRCLATEGLDDRKREYDLGWYAYMHILTLHTCSMHSAYMHNESKCSQQCTHWLAAQSASESRVPMGYILPSKRKSNFIVLLRMPNATFISDIYTPFFKICPNGETIFHLKSLQSYVCH